MGKLRERRMSTEVRKYITARALESTDAREMLADNLEKEIEQKFLDEKPAAHETLIKMISAARNHGQSTLDNPWHLGTLKTDTEIDIPTNAIPYILEALNNRKMLNREREVTIRQAIWISRLYSAIKDKDELFQIAWYYALNERISEISKTEFNTAEYDKRLSNPRQLLEYFQTQIPASYDDFKRGFKESTGGVEMAGLGIPVDHFIINQGKVFATIKIKDNPVQIVLPYPSPESLIEHLKKQSLIKKTIKGESTYIVLKESIDLTFENQDFNKWLYNLIKDGAK